MILDNTIGADWSRIRIRHVCTDHMRMVFPYNVRTYHPAAPVLYSNSSESDTNEYYSNGGDMRWENLAKTFSRDKGKENLKNS